MIPSVDNVTLFCVIHYCLFTRTNEVGFFQVQEKRKMNMVYLFFIR